MTETPSDMPPGTWQVPACPLLIQYSPAMLNEIRLAVVDAFFSLPRGGAEIGGLLFGSHDQKGVTITTFRPMDCEHAMGPTFVLSDNDKARLKTQLEESRKDPLLSQLEIVGWYHSHTRSDIFLSQLDLEIYQEFFPEPWQVALVLRPAGMKPTRAGFFFRDGSGAVHNTASYHEFVVAIKPAPPAGSNGRPVVESAARKPAAGHSPASAPESTGDETSIALPPANALLPRLDNVVARLDMNGKPATEARPAEFVPPAFMIPAGEKPSRAKLWVGLALLVGLAAAAYVTSDYWMKSPAKANLHLQAFDHEGQLRIQWEGAQLASTNVQGGSLQIMDGSTSTIIPLDAPRLRSGSFQYVRRTEMVEAHLTVRTGQGSALEEFTTFYGQPKQATSGAGSATAPSDLAMEAARARGDLKKEELRSLELERTLDQMRRQMRRDEERKRVDNQMPAPPSVPQPTDTQTSAPKLPTPPSPRGNLPTITVPNTAPSTTNATPQLRPQGTAQSLVTQALKLPAPRLEKPAEAPIVRPPVSAEKPRTTQPAPQAGQASLSGRWVYSPAAKSGSAFAPESVTIDLTEAHNQVRGDFAGRYKVPKGHSLNPRVNFSFEGPVRPGSSKFTFNAADGLKGEIELIRLPNKQDAMEVVWYSERDKLTFHDLFFRLP